MYEEPCTVVLLYQYSFIEIFLSFSNHASNVQRCDYLPLQKVVGAAAAAHNQLQGYTRQQNNLSYLVPQSDLHMRYDIGVI